MSQTLFLAAGSANAGIRTMLDDKFKVIETVSSLDGLLEKVEMQLPKIILISRYLPGLDDLIDLLPALRSIVPRARIVLLLGEVNSEARDILRTAACVGIYNVIPGDEPSEEELLDGLQEQRDWKHIAPLLFNQLKNIQVELAEQAPPEEDTEQRTEKNTIAGDMQGKELGPKTEPESTLNDTSFRPNKRVKARLTAFLSNPRRPGNALSINMAKPFPRGILAVCGFQGGVGRTTVTAHVLSWLSGHVSPIIAVDAARPFPMLGQAIGSWRATGFRDALQGDPIEWSISSTSIDGVDLLASGFTTLPDQPSQEDVANLLKYLSTSYAWVVVDTPSDPDTGELRGALMVATTVFWVVDSNLVGLDRIQALGRVLAPDADHAVVLNRAEGSGFTAFDIEEYLQMPVAMTVPDPV